MRTSDLENVSSTTTLTMIPSISLSQESKTLEFHKESSSRDISYLIQKITPSTTLGLT